MLFKFFKKPLLSCSKSLSPRHSIHIFLAILAISKGDGFCDTWSTPEILSNVSKTAKEPQLAMTPDGNSVAVWWEDDRDYSIIGSILPISNTTWTPTNPASLIPTADQKPQVAITADGRAVSIWTDSGSAKSSKLSPFSAATWDSESTIESGSFDDSPQIGIDDIGNAVAVWEDNGAIESAILSPFTGTWTPATGALPVANADYPQVAVASSSGRAVGIWELNTGLGAATLASTSSTWVAANTNLPTAAGAPKIGIDSSGNAVAVWIEGGTAIKGGRLAAGETTWNITNQLTPGTIDGVPDIAVSPDGRAVAVWSYDSGGGLVVFQAATLEAGSTTWIPTDDITGSVDSSSDPKVAVNAKGNAVATFSYEVNGNTEVFVSTLSFTQTAWSTPIQIYQGPILQTSPQIAISSDGQRAVVVWNALEGGFEVINAAIGTDFSFAPSPANNLKGVVVDNRFLTQTDHFHKLTWSASDDSDVVGYRVYVNGKVVATILNSQPLEATFHNQKKGVAVTYTLVAYGKSDVESNPIAVTLK